MANESLFQLAFSGELLHLAFDVAVAVLLYVLLRPVSRNIALLAAFMRLASDIVLAVASLSHLAALQLLENGGYLASFQPAFVAELGLALWLIIKGVGVDRWREALRSSA